ncbi:hypothetical protein HAX54_045340 [Datura stramonium]|uniref:F-box protein n=1 Tax=Datura stramonium TaxID=4076 RepID=A0ABS8SQL2_DATST|nr:hypothetical protein [Datura stramonium]
MSFWNRLCCQGKVTAPLYSKCKTSKVPMALECLIELLGSICHKICRGDDEEEELAEIFGRLPDCLVIDILSRLPMDTVVRFRWDSVVNGALHWIMYSDLEKKKMGLPPNCSNNGIIAFRMDEEQLSAKPHPGSVCNTEHEHRVMTLLVKENCLSFCHLLGSRPGAGTVDIWILEDYEMWAWNQSLS